jgi:uncharacterized protein YjbI with pentapeptide repeats
MDIINGTPFKPGWIVGRVPPLALSATVIVKGTFSMTPGERVVPVPEDGQMHLSGDLRLDDDPKGALRYPSDFALYKPRTDLLLTGSAYAVAGSPVTATRVSFGLDGWSKTLLVVGNRVMKHGKLGDKVSDPDPFTTMPIGWERAFGGPGHPENSAGRGFAEETNAEEARFRRMPNVEFPDRLVVDPGNGRQSPAGFGPIPDTAPARMAKLGTFDQNWLKKNWPWFPDDFDWTYFNAAPPDQQLRGFLKGTETLRLKGLHPSAETLECRLPGLRVRWFIADHQDDRPRFREVLLNLDTLWVDTENQKLVLLWRGVAPVSSKKMREVDDLLIVSEPLASPAHPADYYERKLKELKAVKAAEGKAAAPALKEEPSPPEPVENWKVGFDKKFAESDHEFQQLDEIVRQADAESRQSLIEAGVSPALLSKPPKMNWKVLWEEEVAHYQHLLAVAPQVARAFPPPPSFDEFMKTVPEDDETPEPPKAPLPAEKEPFVWTRDKVVSWAKEGKSLSSQDLTGLDLSGLDISGIDFKGAILEGVDLTGTNLSRSDLSKAVLAHATMKESDMTAAILVETDLQEADLTLAVLVDIRADRANFSGARLSGASLKGATAVRARFSDADLTEANLEGGDFSSAVLQSAKLVRANLSGAVFDNSSVVWADGTGANLTEANLTKLHAAGSNFTGARFHNAQAPGSTWEEACLDGADFTDAGMQRSNLIAASLKKTVFIRADLSHSSLAEAKLEDTVFLKANLFRSSLEEAALTRADFRGSNLYEVEFLEAKINSADFRDANLKGTKLAAT